ncbi:TPA: hypothetical protein QCX48_005497 [Bacillus mycoides]|uniref:hypothetical protein n=1 Tax=Bacillus TaxID=1386 RepID=UPI002E21EB5D|nr:hypothetical protein [Bacillus mycoides]HDR7590555.1 hypothetical protein [Bacillus mycoides]
MATVPVLTVARTTARHEGRQGMAMTRHTTRGEDNSKERTNETRTNKRIKKEKKQVSNE